jgi:hypothetical protein
VAAAIVLLVRPLVHGRQSSPEAWGGLAAAVVIVAALDGTWSRGWAAMAFLLAGSIAHKIEPHGEMYGTFNWIPFRQHTQAPLDAFGNVLAATWPFLAMGCLAAILDARRDARQRALIGGFVVLTVVVLLESFSWPIAGRHGDVTNILLAVAGWTIPWLLARGHAALKTDE